ncbi:LysM peptidoglycan-binding domain-containing protein [Roseovarius aquimarinus]|uniref:LysM peptidoglycan-binding domain-containing protein n=1 Tax=Roseovarius aquimarinus TaxID=1229156 RepID=A0ABW7I9G4_9RHOB
MIRPALLSLGFLGVTGALIAIQPTAPRSIDGEDEPVTRASAGMDTEIDIDSVGAWETASVEAPIPVAAPLAPVAETQPPRMPETELERMIAAALGEGQSDAYIDALVTSAAASGVDVPGEFVGEGGRIDTQALIAALSHHTARDIPAPSGAYTVQPGDTLASIAYRSYGRTDMASRITEANRATFDARPALMVGQRLIIPPRS